MAFLLKEDGHRAGKAQLALATVAAAKENIGVADFLMRVHLGEER